MRRRKYGHIAKDSPLRYQKSFSCIHWVQTLKNIQEYFPKIFWESWEGQIARKPKRKLLIRLTKQDNAVQHLNLVSTEPIKEGKLIQLKRENKIIHLLCHSLTQAPPKQHHSCNKANKTDCQSKEDLGFCIIWNYRKVRDQQTPEVDLNMATKQSQSFRDICLR